MHRRGRSLLAALAATAVIVAAGGCGAENGSGGAEPGASATRAPRVEISPAPGDHTMTLDWADVERSWVLHAPAGYRPGTPVPLVVALHGHSQSIDALRGDTGLDAVADRKGFLVAYPKSLGVAFSALTCCGDSDDVGFVRAMVGLLVRDWSVDPARVYATGFSNGADMAFKLGVEAADVFAAIAPVSGAFRGSRTTDDGYKPSRPVSLITFIGYTDRNAQGMYSGLARWQRNLGCDVGEPTWVDKRRTVNRTVSTCADGSEVVDYTVNGMGHAWPSAAGFTTAIDATVAMWDFFAAHPRRP